MRIPIMILLAITGLAAESLKAVPMPPGTRASGSYVCEDGKGFEALIDGDEESLCIGSEGTASGQPLVITIRFARPVRGVRGLRTGPSDRFHNYVPQEIGIYGDTTGDQRADTLLVTTTRLGPGRENIQDHLFTQLPPALHGLELRITKYTQQAVKRAPALGELWLLGPR